MGGEVDIERYLSEKDPHLGPVIKIVRAARGELLRPHPSSDSPFQALVRAVIYQRVSEASGSTVFSRLEEITKGKLAPREIILLTEARIQKAGLSRFKATYVVNLAKWFNANPKTVKELHAMSDGEVVDALTTIPGIGLWTVNVFLVFYLGRLDVAPAPDAVIRAIAKIVYGLKAQPSVRFIKERTEAWRPYRSIATMYLYQAGKLKLTRADLRRGRAGVDDGGIRSGS
jgi:DNA-3-methyladenine glycosylase II